MKIRNGFVSNSSSSSFILLAKEDLVKETLLEINDECVTAVVMSSMDKEKVFGQNCFVHHDCCDNGRSSIWDYFVVKDEFDQEKVDKCIDDDEYEYACYSSFFDKFLKLMRKKGNKDEDYFEIDIDF